MSADSERIRLDRAQRIDELNVQAERMTDADALQSCEGMAVPLGSLIHLADGRLALVDAVDGMTGTVSAISIVADRKQGRAHGGVPRRDA